ncbi:MAG: alpha-amylase [Clostridiales bacterium]|jgi:hypothetical protein|nr:alpha-amylase [Clostridiales bacterium]
MSDQSIKFRNQVIYCLSVRSYTPDGTFFALENELENIRALGVDIIELLPIHPVGDSLKKGRLGSLFAVKDTRATDPRLGSIEDFKRLVDEIHKHKMLCVMNMVLEQTSIDSQTAQNHPEWFYQKKGKIYSRSLDRQDVADLDFNNKDLWSYQIDIVKYWAGIVDGFNCSSSSLIPLAFWEQAREEVNGIKSEFIWLADTLEPEVIAHYRNVGHYAASDAELFRVFDICLDSDTIRPVDAYLRGDIPLSALTYSYEWQEAMYPKEHCKLRFLEMPYRRRIRSVITNNATLRSWTAFNYLLKGAALIQAWQEYALADMPALTEPYMPFGVNHDLSGFMRKLYKIKKNPLIANGAFYIQPDDKSDIATYRYIYEHKWLEGSFSLKGKSGIADTFVPNGDYLNLLDYTVISVKHGKYGVDENPVLFCSDYRSVE